MTHDGSEDPIDFTISNAIYDLIGGKSSAEVADELGWEIKEIMGVHPKNLSRQRLIEIADEQYWPAPHIEELLDEIERYWEKFGEKEIQSEDASISDAGSDEQSETSNDEIIPMIGMTLDEWSDVLQKGMDRKKVEDEWRETIAQQLETMDLTGENLSVRQRLLGALRNDPDIDARFARAVKIMIELIPLGLKRTLGIKGHLLGSVSREYHLEHELLWRAIKEEMQP